MKHMGLGCRSKSWAGGRGWRWRSWLQTMLGEALTAPSNDWLVTAGEQTLRLKSILLALIDSGAKEDQWTLQDHPLPSSSERPVSQLPVDACSGRLSSKAPRSSVDQRLGRAGKSFHSLVLLRSGSRPHYLFVSGPGSFYQSWGHLRFFFFF